ncbi:MAG: CoA-binding protein [Ignavibacteria bacterium]|nr:CoA-binding protein [Ignavibacteria bacterium]
MINKQILCPESIIVIGGSNDITKAGGKVVKNLLDGNFKGKILISNPKETVIQGIPCVQDLNEIENVDLAIIAIASKYVNSTVEFLAREKGTRAFIVLSAGFSEIGEVGKEIETELVQIVNKYEAALIGPNCIGVLTPHYSGVFAGPVPRLEASGCDFVTGSGATACFILEKAILLGISFSSIFSVGNSAQIGVEEVIKHWDENFDEKTSSKIKLIYIEKVDKPNLLLKHCRSLIKKGCRIAAIKAGTTEAGSRAVSSHTGALAGSDLAVDALFKKAGIVRCYSKEELLYVAGVFAQKKFNGKNFAVITHAGGPGVMLSDTLSKEGMSVPHIQNEHSKELLSKLLHGSSVANPIDFLATGTAEHLNLILDYVDEKFNNIDASVVIFGTTGLSGVIDVYNLLYQKIKSSKKPIFPVLPSVLLAKDEIEHFKSLGGIAFEDEVVLGQAIAKVQKTSFFEEEKPDLKIDIDIISKIKQNFKNGYLEPSQNYQLLKAANIPLAQEKTCLNLNEALDFANEIAFPIVMKVVGPVHKTDVGGVRLGISSKEETEKTFKDLMKIKDASGVLIQKMMKKGTELFIGAKKEDKFGHIILCGLGGIFIEVFKDFSAALSPVSQQEALDMIHNLKSYPLFQGVRGEKGINKRKFAEIVVNLSNLLAEMPEIAELDLNPLIAVDDEIIAVDSRIRIEK